MKHALATLGLNIIALAGIATGANGDTIFDTGIPDGGMIGYFGFDLSVDQSVAVSFTPDQDYRLDQVGLWLMSNDFNNAGAPYTVSVRTDDAGGMTIPGSTVLESWDVQTAAIGWNPILESVDSVLNPILSAGTTYWIVAESDSPGGVESPVWVSSNQFQPVWQSIQNSLNPDGAWISGYTTGAPGLVVSGTVVPAPASLALIGLSGLVCTRRRR